MPDSPAYCSKQHRSARSPRKSCKQPPRTLQKELRLLFPAESIDKTRHLSQHVSVRYARVDLVDQAQGLIVRLQSQSIKQGQLNMEGSEICLKNQKSKLQNEVAHIGRLQRPVSRGALREAAAGMVWTFPGTISLGEGRELTRNGNIPATRANQTKTREAMILSLDI
eukprot:5985747-Amphidinium_carterae.2